MQELDWAQVGTHLIQLSIAFVLALPVAWNRELKARGAGLRTFPLVSIAACGYMLVGMEVYTGSDAEARVMYGIITGMGFIGGGAILKDGANVSGTATAASLWNTGAIGISVAWQAIETLFACSVFQAGSQSRRKVEGVCPPIETLQQRVRASLEDPEGTT